MSLLSRLEFANSTANQMPNCANSMDKVPTSCRFCRQSFLQHRKIGNTSRRLYTVCRDRCKKNPGPCEQRTSCTSFGHPSMCQHSQVALSKKDSTDKMYNYHQSQSSIIFPSFPRKLAGLGYGWLWLVHVIHPLLDKAKVPLQVNQSLIFRQLREAVPKRLRQAVEQCSEGGQSFC